MGWNEEAKAAAARREGEVNWEKYYRRDRAGKIFAVALVVGVAVFAYVRENADAVRTYAMYGIGGVLIFAALVLFVYTGVRTYRSRTRTYRPETYVRPDAYDE